MTNETEICIAFAHAMQCMDEPALRAIVACAPARIPEHRWMLCAASAEIARRERDD